MINLLLIFREMVNFITGYFSLNLSQSSIIQNSSSIRNNLLLQTDQSLKSIKLSQNLNLYKSHGPCKIYTRQIRLSCNSFYKS